MNDFGKGRWYLTATFALAGIFLVNKYFEYADHIVRGEGPAHNTFLAIYYTMTGLHGLHIIGGMIVMAYLILPGAGLWKRHPEQYTNRIEITGLYWHFVDLVWIFLFPVLYLL
jgi:cytochrome c oxidase subunit III